VGVVGHGASLIPTTLFREVVECKTPHGRRRPTPPRTSANVDSRLVDAVPSGGHRQEHQQRDKWGLGTGPWGKEPDLRAARAGASYHPRPPSHPRPTTRETRTVPPRTHHGSLQKQGEIFSSARCAGESHRSNANRYAHLANRQTHKLYGRVQKHIQILCRVSALYAADVYTATPKPSSRPFHSRRPPLPQMMRVRNITRSVAITQTSH